MIEQTQTGNRVSSSEDETAAHVRACISAAIQRIGSVRDAAAAAGVSEDQIARWKNGSSKPPLLGVMALFLAADLPLSVLTARGSPNEAGGPSLAVMSQSQALEQPEQFPSDLAMIPRLDVTASAGFGSLADVEHHVGLVAFHADWLRRRGITPEAARALTARGDSMEPTIRSGDLLLVDTAIDHVKDNGIYVVVLTGMVLVKRIHVKMDGSLRLISDNKDLYEPEDISPNRVQDLVVAGRVMWYGRSI